MVNQVAARAADLLETKGWHQGDGEGGRSYCLVQVLHTVANCFDLYDQAYDHLNRVLGRTGSLIPWNDEKGRTKEEVVGLLRKASTTTVRD